MKKRGIGLVSAVLASVLSASVARAMDCPKPTSQAATNYTATAKGQLAKFGPLTGAQVDTRFNKTTTNLFAQYPNADRVVISQGVLSAACQIIAESKLSDEKKFDMLMRATVQVRQIMR